jgi:hypothetical protein
MKLHRAPNPYTSQKKSNSIILTRLSRFLGQFILAAQGRKPTKWLDEQVGDLTKKYSLDIQNIAILTHDKAILDTVSITPIVVKDTPIHERRFIIKFKGNKGLYENSLEEYTENAVAYEATVVCSNYRGVARSQKAPVEFQDLVIDGIAQVQRLLDDGVRPENILLDGESLGAGVATVVAWHFHQKKMPVYLWNSRSFSSLAQVAVSMTFPAKTPKVLKKFLVSLITALGWDVDASSIYEKIDPKYKAYMVIAKPSAKSKGDGAIPHECSLHKAVGQKEKASGTQIGRKVYSNGFFDIGHKDKLENLVSKDNESLTGQDLFGEFIQRLGM